MNWLLARMYDRAMIEVERASLAGWRAALLAEASGRVLEVGAGTGANLPYYTIAVDELVAAEPNEAMRQRLLRRMRNTRYRQRVSADAAEQLRFPDGHFDSVVCTLVLCSVADLARALSEMHRVLKPGGKLLFIEHVAAHGNPSRVRWQRRVEPLWRRLAGNCHLTRDTHSAIAEAGFSIERLQRESLRKAMALVRPTIRGVARAHAEGSAA